MFALVAMTLALLPALDETVRLKLVAQDGMKKVGRYSPMRADLSATRPGSITKLPADLKAPLFGTVEFAGAGTQIFHVVVDEPEGEPSRLFVDTNGNGDLTDDPGTKWKVRESKESEKKFVQYNGSFQLNVSGAGEPYEVWLGAYRFDKNDPDRPSQKNKLLYYRDYVTEGAMNLGDKTYTVLLNDDTTRGDFRGRALPANASDKETSGVEILIDVNANGKFDRRGEAFDVRKPFNIGGTTYEIVDMASTGLTFKVVESSRVVAEIPLPPEHDVGKKITSFRATDMAGKPVTFPGDYTGKIVMIDFWATWCAPCMKEMPGLVQAYEKFNDKGFEVLGITLDFAKAQDKIKTVAGDQNMTWRQVYDGRGWGAEIARLYVIRNIPSAYLVDGDTGIILATGRLLQGRALSTTIQTALARKSRQ
ncbi:MAG: TlpA family protein disulfide reductase [Pyrinomonadaceae bacterium]|nr:TlpA family protein disulfide reductase [Phycisphaerales bacterium]